MEPWVCPNDRQLTLRAKLGAGWSVHTFKTTSMSKPDPLSAEESDHIMRVIRMAEQVDLREKDRIGLLVDKVDNMKRNALGNGRTHCVLCGDEFGMLSASAVTCNDCHKAVCTQCGVDTVNKGRSKKIWLCKICSEHRELWKRSGAWFYNGLPHILNPRSDTANKSHHTASRPIKVSGGNTATIVQENGANNGRVKRVRGPKGAKTYGGWNEGGSRDGGQKGNNSSGSEEEITVNRRRIKPIPDSGDSDSIDSACVNTRLDQSSNGSATSGSQWSITESGHDEFDTHDSSHLRADLHLATNLTSGPLSSSLFHPPGGGTGQAFNLSNQVNDVRDPRKTSTVEAPQSSGPQTRRISSVENDGGSSLGTLEFSLIYNSTDLTLQCTIHRAKDLPSMDRNGLSDPYVKLHLLPSANKSTKLRTTTKPKTLNPSWCETLVYHCVTDDDVIRKVLRLSVYDEDPIGSDFIGETRVPLRTLKPGVPRDYNVYLSGLQVDKKDNEVSDDDRGRILIGLTYRDLSEKLIINVKQCAALKAMDSNGYSDPYVKLYLRPDPHKRSKMKTKVKTKTLNPEFNEEFVYTVKMHELANKTLDVTVWDKDFGKFHDYIGGIQLSINAKGELLRHWFDTLKNPNKLHERWHFLSAVEPTINDLE